MNALKKQLAIIAGCLAGATLLAASLAFAQSDTTPPSQPYDLSASAVSSSQIDLSWAASSDNVGVAGYNIFRNGTDIGSTSGTSYDDTGLAPGTTYTYAVDAYDAAGNLSTLSSSVSAATQNDTAPSVPTNLVATAVSASQVNLSWNASSGEDGVAGYYVYRNGDLIGSTGATSYSDPNLSASTNYTYTVAAYDSNGDVSSQSSSVSATTLSSGTTTTTQNYVVPPTVDIGSNGSILVHGLTVTSVGTNTFTGTVWGITYTVNYTPNSNNGFEFLLRGGNGAQLNANDIQVGDQVGVQGSITQSSPNTITAEVVRNYSITSSRTQPESNGNGYGNEYGNGNSNGNGESIESLQTLLQQLLSQFHSVQGAQEIRL